MAWMQSNAVTMKSSSDGQLTPMEQIQPIAQQQGLSVASQQNAEQSQLVVKRRKLCGVGQLFDPTNAKWFSSIEKMELVSYNAGQIKLSAKR